MFFCAVIKNMISGYALLWQTSQKKIKKNFFLLQRTGQENKHLESPPDVSTMTFFTMYLHHFLPNDLHLLKDTIQDNITTSTSPPKRCTKTPIGKLALEVASWTTTRKATTASSSLVFEENVDKDGISSQMSYKINIDCPCYKASIAPNQKNLNDETIKRTVGKSLWGKYERSGWIAVANC